MVMSVFSLLKKGLGIVDLMRAKSWQKTVVLTGGSGTGVMATFQLRPISADSSTGITKCVLYVHASEPIVINDPLRWAFRATELYCDETGDDCAISVARIELDYPTYQKDAYAPWRGEGK